MEHLIKRSFYLAISLMSCYILSACNSEVLGCFTDDCLGTTTVYTSKGKLKGLLENNTKKFYQIPYAKPPVGDLRFREPQTNDAWTGTKVVSVNTMMGCKQFAMPTAIPALLSSEDCLKLNVWAPKDADNAAVMVFFHGGGYVLGSGLEPSNIPTPLVETEGVIVVTVNFRLGPLGFLSHSAISAETPYGGSGNAGVLDQAMALQWVKDEIAAFGGDPNNITVYGESAGGLATCAMMASPLTRDLFQNAIIMSGPCTSWPMLTQAEAEDDGEDFAALMGCTNIDPDTELACLRALDVEVMKDKMNIQTNGLFQEGLSEWAFFPSYVIDNHIFTKTIKLMLADSTTKQKVIIGNVKDEGSLFEAYRDSPNASGYTAAYLESRYPGQGADLFANYPLASFNTTGDAMAAIAGDGFLFCPSVYMSDYLFGLEYSVHQYLFTQYSDSILRTMSLAQLGNNAPDLGIMHSSEMPFIMGQSGPTATLENPTQWIVVDGMQNYFTNLAKVGTPNNAGGYITWPAYNTTTRKYLEIGQGFDDSKANLHSATCAYWNNL